MYGFSDLPPEEQELFAEQELGKKPRTERAKNLRLGLSPDATEADRADAIALRSGYIGLGGATSAHRAAGGGTGLPPEIKGDTPTD